VYSKFVALWRRMNPSEWYFLFGRAFERGAKSIANQMRAETMGGCE